MLTARLTKIILAGFIGLNKANNSMEQTRLIYKVNICFFSLLIIATLLLAHDVFAIFPFILHILIDFLRNC